MTATIKIGYDPKDATASLATLEKQVKQNSTTMDKFGKTAISSGKDLDEFSKHVNASSATLSKYQAEFSKAQQKLSGGAISTKANLANVEKSAVSAGSKIGTLGGQIVSLSSALGVTSGPGGAIAGATAAFGDLGVGAVALGGIVASSVSIWSDYSQEIHKTADEIDGLKGQVATAVTWLGELSGAVAKGLSDQQQFDKDLEQRAVAAFKRDQERAERINAIREEFAEKDAKRIEDLGKIELERTLSNRGLLEIKQNLVDVAALEARHLRLAQNLSGTLEEQEQKRLEINKRLNELAIEKTALLQRESEIQARIAQEQAREAAELQRQQEDAHRERLRQIEEERRKTEELAKERERLVERDATRLLNSLNNGAKVATQLDKTINKAIGGDSGEVKRGVEQGPLNFAGSGGLASYAQGLQAATVAGAGFHLGQLGQSRFQFGGIIPRGAFGGGGGGGVVVPAGGGAVPAGGGAAEQSLLEKLAAAIDPRRIAEQIAKNREADIDQARAGALAGRGNIRPGGDEARAINRRFDREEQAARRGAFRGDVTETERANAVAQIADAQAQANGLQGDALDVFRKALKLAQEQQQDTAKLQQDVKNLEAVVDALSSNRRSHALRAGRRP